MSCVDAWRKLRHSNIIRLQEVFTTKDFGDHCKRRLVLPGLPRLSYLSWWQQVARAHSDGTHVLLSPSHDARAPPCFPGCLARAAVVFVSDYHPNTESLLHRHLMVRGPPIAEPLLWTYIIQISSVLRAVHAANLAVRVLEPSKVLVQGRSKILVSSICVTDVLQHEVAQQPSLAHLQLEDMHALGRLILALACGSMAAVTRETLPQVSWRPLVLGLATIPSHPRTSSWNAVHTVLVHPQDDLRSHPSHTPCSQWHVWGRRTARVFSPSCGTSLALSPPVARERAPTT